MNNISKLALSVLCLTQINSNAAVVIDNLTNGTIGSTGGLTGPNSVAPIFNTPLPNRQAAFSFTTGPTAGNLLGLEAIISVDLNSDPINVSLNTGSNVPGGLTSIPVSSVTPPTSTTIQSLVDFSPSSPIALSANTTYWLQFTVPSGAARYGFSNSNVLTAAPGWTLGNTWFKEDIDPWNELTSGAQAQVRIEVESVPAVPVPEPSAALLGGLGFLLLFRRRVR